LEGLTYDYGLGPNTFPNWLQGKINQITSQPGGSVFVQDTSSISRIFSSRLSYSKGAMLLHMLRWKLGDEAFFRGIRQYLEAPELAFGYARSADLQLYLEQESGQNLQEFFADWLYGEGYPSYEVEWYQEEETVYVKLSQTASHPSVDFFEMPVPIQFTLGNGDTVTEVFSHSFDGQIFSFSAQEQVVLATFDPEKWLLSADNQVRQQVFTSSKAPRKQRLRLFPNPVKERIFFQLPAGERVEQLQLFDANGQLVRNYRPSQRELSAAGLPAGTYFLRAVTEDEAAVRKVLIQ